MDKCKHQIRKKGRIRQGDIIRNVRFHESFHLRNGILELSFVDFPYAYVLTQDCDLESEYRQRQMNLTHMIDNRDSKALNVDKTIISVLLAPVYNYSSFLVGNHLHGIVRDIYPSNFEVKSQVFPKHKNNKNSTSIDNLENNTNPRYHYISMYDDKALSISIIDFKHFFSVGLHDLEVIRKQNYELTLCPLYREKISHRFMTYLSRIGLPHYNPRNKQQDGLPEDRDSIKT